MKSRFLSFVAGMLVTALFFGGSVTAFAASNTFKIEGSPINVLVNGEVFKPKDVKGNDALVFTYNGTTYAPLRALAEAYGLEVGYDGSKNLATVTAPTATVKSEFASAWTITEKPVTNYGPEKIFTAKYNGSLSMDEFKAWWKSFSTDEIQSQAEALAAEAQSQNPGYTVTLYFSYDSWNLGTAFAFGDYERSNFTSAGVWIK